MRYAAFHFSLETSSTGSTKIPGAALRSPETTILSEGVHARSHYRVFADEPSHLYRIVFYFVAVANCHNVPRNKVGSYGRIGNENGVLNGVSWNGYCAVHSGRKLSFRVVEVGAHCEACRFGGDFVVLIIEHAVVGFIFVLEEAQVYRGASACLYVDFIEKPAIAVCHDIALAKLEIRLDRGIVNNPRKQC